MEVDIKLKYEAIFQDYIRISHFFSGEKLDLSSYCHERKKNLPEKHVTGSSIRDIVL